MYMLSVNVSRNMN